MSPKTRRVRAHVMITQRGKIVWIAGSPCIVEKKEHFGFMRPHSVPCVIEYRLPKPKRGRQ